ncbi:polypeptide deformylase [Streptomyces sviceus ATCC 29083]|uniref:Polypeptide deformylase n=1 Tax=Streptomyces sviceus (strain ATCC 29083 / DSM 924 / JCM 4929 / NBRC 13980 / NCIMB 11184 / NRRL 5439 / UC 5370) TaxID=463191 RepID=B5HQD7_STRX2|nr:polypeptide deformylase [Streptomyces sviceus ATCC 29083]
MTETPASISPTRNRPWPKAGAGLAANQVGVGLRLFVYDCPDDDEVRHVGHLVNPELDQLDPAGRRLLDDSEGCLSGPGAVMAVPRPDRAGGRGFDRDGEPLVIEGTGYFAGCPAHETDTANIEALNGAQGTVSASGSGPAPTPTPR